VDGEVLNDAFTDDLFTILLYETLTSLGDLAVWYIPVIQDGFTLYTLLLYCNDLDRLHTFKSHRSSTA